MKSIHWLLVLGFALLSGCGSYSDALHSDMAENTSSGTYSPFWSTRHSVTDTRGVYSTCIANRDHQNAEVGHLPGVDDEATCAARAINGQTYPVITGYGMGMMAGPMFAPPAAYPVH